MNQRAIYSSRCNEKKIFLKKSQIYECLDVYEMIIRNQDRQTTIDKRKKFNEMKKTSFCRSRRKEIRQEKKRQVRRRMNETREGQNLKTKFIHRRIPDLIVYGSWTRERQIWRSCRYQIKV